MKLKDRLERLKADADILEKATELAYGEATELYGAINCMEEKIESMSISDKESQDSETLNDKLALVLAMFVGAQYEQSFGIPTSWIVGWKEHMDQPGLGDVVLCLAPNTKVVLPMTKAGFAIAQRVFKEYQNLDVRGQPAIRKDVTYESVYEWLPFPKEAPTKEKESKIVLQ